MTTPSPTLADAVIRDMWSRDSISLDFTSRRLSEWRWDIAKAHKFVLDPDMSGFLSDLTHAPFQRGVNVRVPDTINAMRHGSMLPHPMVWVELDGKALQHRQCELSLEMLKSGWEPYTDPWGQPHSVNKVACESRWGFLLWQDPQVETVVHGVHFFSGGYDQDPDDAFARPTIAPYKFVWNCADKPFHFEVDDPLAGMMMHGISGWLNPHIACVVDWAAPVNRAKRNLVSVIDESRKREAILPRSLPDTAGCARYMLALLSTINDIPIVSTDVKNGKGYMARGNYRKFVDHTVVKLNIPQKVSRQRLAMKFVGAARRRSHDVRGHWRLYQRGEGVLCKPSFHAWGGMDSAGHEQCSSCPAWRTWIAAHSRGDASIAVATHSYAVTHELDGTKQPKGEHDAGQRHEVERRPT